MGEGPRRKAQLSRRSLLLGLGALPLTACVATTSEPHVTAAPSPPAAPAVHGDVQAGILSPATPQAHLRIIVFDAPAIDTAREFLAAFGVQITEVVEHRQSGDPTDATTITVGVSDSWAQALWGQVGAVDPLPTFARDALAPEHTGGDVVVQICASEAWIIADIAAQLTAWVTQRGGSVRWSQDGARDVISGVGYARNLTGFHDGIINPATDSERERGVWSAEPAGTSVMVVRRLAIDVTAFLGLATSEQERLIGREKASGAPLSGGAITDEISLFAKDNAGNYLVPNGAHAREAHPAAMGEALMLRRGYAYTRGEERGHLFISFQSDVSVFTKTQLHLDAADNFMKHVSCTASGVFRILPGFSETAPLASA